MLSMHDKISIITKKTSGYWCERICSQIQYAAKVSKINNGEFDTLLESTVNFLWDKIQDQGAISKIDAQNAETMLSPISSKAKSLKMICAAHAHIDMNWMWGFAETVSITIDTFRTMLNLMNEYPQFKFSQSQASVYKIVEDYDPDMLEEIKTRVKDGRWEVTASTWVETDKNMPNGESLARHILYTKQYLSKLLDIDPNSLNLDFEPDTFGHNQNVPEIMVNGGVKYYYHCRGYEDHYIYRWQSPSGSTVLVYREPVWYNASIESSMAFHVPEFCSKHGLDTMLKVYGVGDHGGGPTRRDMEKLIDMATWPVFPDIRFGTFGEYFSILEQRRESFPLVTNELNCVFSGCYTTQTRIKMANRIGEAKLNEAEAYSTLSSVFAKGSYRTESFENAWKKVLFNHFHDILPGSGIVDTREYALGEFQKVLATTNTEINRAIRNIAAQIDTSSLKVAEDDTDTISEGAGVGYGIKDFGVPQTERGKGKTRIYHVFNSSSSDRKELTEIILWDWPGDFERLQIKDFDGNSIPYQFINENLVSYMMSGDYWAHSYKRILVDVNVPAYGYNTYILSEKSVCDLTLKLPTDPRVEKPDSYVLENEKLKVVFHTSNASIISLLDKTSNRELVGSNPSGIFRLIDEDDSKGMTAWIVGRYMNIESLDQNVKIIGSETSHASLRQWIKYAIKFRNSNLKVTVSLDKESSILNYDVECDWQELAQKGKFIPQLNFHMPFAYNCNKYKYDIPFGTAIRDEVDMDVPANSWAMGVPQQNDDTAIALLTNTKYGFRGFENAINVDLIRSSYDPDPYPDNGIHKFRLGVAVITSSINKDIIEKAFAFNHPLSTISTVPHPGNLPMTESFISQEAGSVALSAIKMPENKDAKTVIIRVYETEGNDTIAKFNFASDLSDAWYVDLNECKIFGDTDIIDIPSSKGVSFKVRANSTVSVCVKF